MRLVDPPGGRPWALFALCGASLLLNVVLLAKVASGPEAADVARTGDVAVAVGPDADHGLAVAAVEVDEATVDEAIAAVEAPEEHDLHVASASVVHSLARTFQNADPERGNVLSAIYARLFFWDLDLRSDLQRGDRVAVAYEWDGELADIAVASYDSKKLGRTLVGYRYQATGDAYPSYWDADGREIARRLNDGPLREYEQVTSLLKDRPTHKGMDFKVAEGTDLVSPKAGKVLRTDWNLKYNGNCIEVRFDDGVTARFLHLSETGVKPGQRVSAGQRLGATGNTGRSTAPHLHYELDRAGRVLDPIDYHGTHRRELPEADRAGFAAERARLDRILAATES